MNKKTNSKQNKEVKTIKKIFDKKINKKGQMQVALYGLLTLALFIVIVGYIVGFGQSFIQQTRDNLQTRYAGAGCNATVTSGCGAGYNATVYTQQSLATVAEGQGTVATVGILVIVVGLLVGVVAVLGFAGRRQENF